MDAADPIKYVSAKPFECCNFSALLRHDVMINIICIYIKYSFPFALLETVIENLI